MKKLKQYSFFLVIPAIFLVASLIGDYRSKKEANTFSCKFNEITSETVKELDGDFDEDIVKQVNDETPYCKDVCLEELATAKKYPNEWYTSKESRKLCKQAGIILPN
ncbi:MAG: hypothetical protein US50_C0017G0010 [Candidatus Nomurabacteria bacterium GW2011_GWB1_37_5]|uniref:Uncharacterized protein n=1 Tax=Candidatus Nomurabacteria bacterium GW2011_GWB1_37_5 TaxID=1618742 RepID=A0A0G0JF05_9BACT|nr:MAG: hypothetical protein US50_C0017G0010 [Candidatus Nomurabacteria bacterium GW2011_GWB1_37_5]